jgi:copper homeostasis protein
MGGRIQLEICLDSVESAMAAEAGGADRVELCAGLPEGGTTPSAGMIAAVRRKVSIGVQVMIRPRGGDFCYTDDEFAIMQRDILMARQLGADGVVLGLLKVDGSVDSERMRQLVDLARPLNVTCHRAFDMSRDLSRSLDDLVASGADRVLTSGGEKRAEDALETLARLVKRAAGRIGVMACGEIDAGVARAVVGRTGVGEIHAGLGDPVESPMRHRNAKIAMGSLADAEYRRVVVSETGVRALRTALDTA